ncbi:TetR/AcrR family transcriptional regulator [Nocardiopsis ansamitocini]|uniref:TetR family transcriptional regulator n=1 Tax=Nocardiopsis ansamitocini TaxID=1670832 RepID=A0A9W6UJ59_9ACTN|nr:TetR/AcrR family transcriptional regulator [Nocardiopsis ansamitocini]GLU48484.1 TetR family transcriptional regulator [Nocardiopsis ansamitocini]
MEKQPRSRRTRPAKPALSRKWIIAETVKIMRTEGLEKATMRRVAQALDTGPASLYVYVANTAELHAAVLDELIGSLPQDGPGDWQERIHTLLGAYSDLLFRYPGLARSALALRPAGPHTIRLFDRVLGLLIDGDVPADRAAWGTDLLLQQVTATAAEHGDPGSDGIDAPVGGEAKTHALERAVRTAVPATAPHVAAHADAVLAGPPSARSTWAIHVLLTGIAATPIPRQPRTNPAPLADLG